MAEAEIQKEVDLEIRTWCEGCDDKASEMGFDQAEDYVSPRQQQLQLFEPADCTVQLQGRIEAVFKGRGSCCAVHLRTSLDVETRFGLSRVWGVMLKNRMGGEAM